MSPLERVPDSILSKLQGLLSKTVDAGCSVQEEATAAAIAQKLLTQYKLTVADLGGLDNGEKINDDTSLYIGNRKVTWKAYLAGTICDVNGCKLYFHWSYAGWSGQRAKRQVSFRVIGRNSDIEVVAYFFNYLTNKVEQLCKQAMRRGDGVGKRWSNSFKLGAAEVLCTRLREAAAEAREISTSTAIVKVDTRDAEVQKWAEENLKLRSSTRTISVIDPDAFATGVAAGRSINLVKGVGGGSKKPKGELN